MSFELTPATWQLWCFAILVLGMLMAVEWDLREHRIPNTLILFLLLMGVAVHAAGPANGRGGIFDAFPGALGVGSALLGALAGLVIFLPFYLIRAMGAGDVKLLVALGAFVGTGEIVGLALSVLIAGGALAVLRMLLKRNARLVLGNVKLILLGMGHGGARFDPVTQSADRMPYALSFAAGLAVFSYWRLSGGMQILGF
jgi:prepilin peptidase CpaA